MVFTWRRLEKNTRLEGKIMKNREMSIIYLLLLGTLIIALIVQVWLFNIDLSFLESLNTNIIATLIGISVTVLLIDRLLVIHQERENIRVLKNVLGNQYMGFISRISDSYLTFVLKQAPMTEVENKKHMVYATLEIGEFIDVTKKVVDDIDVYVNRDFMQRPIIIKQLLSDRIQIVKAVDVPINYQVFCERYFKQTIEAEINQFLGRYITILPNQIRKHIFKIDDLLKSGLFATSLSTGINLEEVRIEVKSMQEVLENLGKELLSLQKYCV